LEDITGLLSYEVSSRQAMIGCLTDGSSETFWESGEEVS
uniref:DOC domain-containing protein n=1 Tax=Gongylonema pulchrum TaxID=637853 RepID=A0A183D5U0_9BILA